MMKGFNIQQMMKQAQQMQKKMEETQDELRNIQVTSESGGGVISVVFNGKNEFQSIKIKPEAINPDNPESVDADTVEMLEDLITGALKDANKKAENFSAFLFKPMSICFLKQFQLLCNFRFFNDPFTEKQFHHTKLFVGYFQDANVPIFRKHILYT